MNCETLENLLIDRALGSLSPEVEILLAEYLATNAEAAKVAGELSEVVAMATVAIRRTGPQLDLPPRVISLPRWLGARRVLALAASFVVGAGVAFLAMRGTDTRREIPIAHETAAAPVVAQTTQRPPEIERALRTLPFWSKERALLIAGSASESNR